MGILDFSVPERETPESVTLTLFIVWFRTNVIPSVACFRIFIGELAQPPPCFFTNQFFFDFGGFFFGFKIMVIYNG